ncbi:MAG: TlpA disulfide reductase family protein, partial [Gammaproteobacteria bacterium]|nr:TlpA disulfide reductase family protein [Gammaproteobacteria bacterium]
PDFTLPDLENKPRQVSEWDGKLIVINFWATWCPPCREEIPIFIALQEEFADRGLQFIGIALQDADEVRDFVAETGMNYPVLTGYREVIKIAESLGNDIGALPYTVIINRDGVIEFTRAGPMDEPAIRDTLSRYL